MFLSKSTVSYSAIINKRAREEGSEVKYLEEVEGGRERPDGKVLKWVITTPAEKHESGTVPFFCGDITPREWRVSILLKRRIKVRLIMARFLLIRLRMQSIHAGPSVSPMLKS